MSTAAPPATSAAPPSPGKLRPPAVQLLAVAGAIVAATIAAAIVGWLAPELAPHGAPSPTLRGTTGEAVEILLNNARVLAVPLGLTAAAWTIGRTRIVGDAVILGLTLASVVPVGLAIGDHGRDLWPYLPHLPLEWAALTGALAGWVAHRGRRATVRSLSPYIAATLLLVAAAAIVETVAVPHA